MPPPIPPPPPRVLSKRFTLIELLVVVLIIGILAAVALPQYTKSVDKTRMTETLAITTAIFNAAERYKLANESWPTSLDDLDITIPQESKLVCTLPKGGANCSGLLTPLFIITPEFANYAAFKNHKYLCGHATATTREQNACAAIGFTKMGASYPGYWFKD